MTLLPHFLVLSTHTSNFVHITFFLYFDYQIIFSRRILVLEVRYSYVRLRERLKRGSGFGDWVGAPKSNKTFMIFDILHFIHLFCWRCSNIKVLYFPIFSNDSSQKNLNGEWLYMLYDCSLVGECCDLKWKTLECSRPPHSLWKMYHFGKTIMLW